MKEAEAAAASGAGPSGTSNAAPPTLFYECPTAWDHVIAEQHAEYMAEPAPPAVEREDEENEEGEESEEGDCVVVKKM